MKKTHPVWLLVGFILCGGCAAPPDASNPAEKGVGGGTTVPLGTRYSIQSGILGEKREIVVVTPSGYERATGKYPVLYVLDGDENLLTAVSASHALAAAGRIPEMIVVGVSNTKRDRDFTPALVHTTELPPGASAAGGADNFLSFLEKEVAPLVESHYRTQPMRVVIGHSLGGLLAMHALATKPGLFRAYVTIEPSLWWDARGEVARVLDSLRARKSEIGRLAAVEGTSDEGWKPDWAELQKSAPKTFQTSYVQITNEAHENLPYLGIYRGLMALFADYLPAMRHDLARGTLPALDQQYSLLSRDFGYDVHPPLDALLTIANREANQRRFVEARRALARADSLYPGAQSTASFRAMVEKGAAEAKQNGLGEMTPVLSFKPATAAASAPLLGEWSMLTKVEPGTPMMGSATFSLRADSLMIGIVARGVAIDGGDLVERPVPVRLDGNQIRWERENQGGGHEVTTARLVGGHIVGEASMVGGARMPAGFNVPRVTVELTRLK